MNKKIIALILLIIMCVSLSGCNTSIGIIGGADGPQSIIVTSDTDTENCTPLLYKATDKDGNIAWLFGAIHIGKAEFYPLPDYVMNAFDSSIALAIECDTIDFENVFEYMKYTDSTTVKDHIDEQLYDISVQILEENELYDELGDSYMPSVWSLYIDRLTYEKLGFEAQFGVDTYLTDLALESDKKVLEVEGDKLHAQAMAKLSDAVQEMLLMNSVSQYSDSELAKSNADVSLEVWAKGDETEYIQMINAKPQFESEKQKSLYEEYTRVIREERNDQMSEYVKNAMISEKEIFVCVGMAHIIGDNGIVSQLRELGYTVEIVK